MKKRMSKLCCVLLTLIMVLSNGTMALAIDGTILRPVTSGVSELEIVSYEFVDGSTTNKLRIKGKISEENRDNANLEYFDPRATLRKETNEEMGSLVVINDASTNYKVSNDFTYSGYFTVVKAGLEPGRYFIASGDTGLYPDITNANLTSQGTKIWFTIEEDGTLREGWDEIIPALGLATESALTIPGSKVNGTGSSGTVTVANSGHMDLTSVSVALSGTNAGKVSVSPSAIAGTWTGLTSKDFDVTVTDTSAQGNYSAVLDIIGGTASSPGAVELHVPFTFNVVDYGLAGGALNTTVGATGWSYALSHDLSGATGTVSYKATSNGAALAEYGLSLNESTGDISGTPKKSGSFAVEFTATDTGQGDAVATYTITVAKGKPTSDFAVDLDVPNPQYGVNKTITAKTSGNVQSGATVTYALSANAAGYALVDPRTGVIEIQKPSDTLTFTVSATAVKAEYENYEATKTFQIKKGIQTLNGTGSDLLLITNQGTAGKDLSTVYTVTAPTGFEAPGAAVFTVKTAGTSSLSLDSDGKTLKWNGTESSDGQIGVSVPATDYYAAVAEVAVNTKVQSGVPPTGDTPVIAGAKVAGLTLNDVALPKTKMYDQAVPTKEVKGQWTWKTTSEALSVQKDTYTAVFTPDAGQTNGDGLPYIPVEREVAITVVKAVEITGTITKTYDGTAAANSTIGISFAPGAIEGGQDVTIDAVAGTFADKNAGNSVVTVSNVKTAGADMAKYSVTTTTLPGVINQAAFDASKLTTKSAVINQNNSITLDTLLDGAAAAGAVNGENLATVFGANNAAVKISFVDPDGGTATQASIVTRAATQADVDAGKAMTVGEVISETVTVNVTTGKAVSLTDVQSTPGTYVYTVEIEAGVTTQNYAVSNVPVTLKGNLQVNKKSSSSGGGGGGGSSSSEYTVTFNPGNYGTLDVKATIKVSKGGKCSVIPTVTAKEGYKFKGWSKDGKTVIDPSEVVINGTTEFIAVYERSGSASDYDHIKYMSGYPDGSFMPDITIRRSEVASMMAQLSGGYVADHVYTSSLNDLDPIEWYLNYVNYCAEKGYINGYEDGSFKPQANITRAEFATIVGSYMGMSNTGSSTFADVKGHWAEGYISQLAAKGIITGYEDGSFRPNATITRAEATRILNGAFNRLPNKTKVDENASLYSVNLSDVSKDHWAYYEIVEAAAAHNHEDFH